VEGLLKVGLLQGARAEIIKDRAFAKSLPREAADVERAVTVLKNR
jgi:hypothetical protein